MATKKKSMKRAAPAGEAVSVRSAAQAASLATSRGARRLAAAAAGTPMRALNTDLTSELNNIDFHKMIGGPLQAAVDAQVASSLATIDFINKVGFTTPVDSSGEPDPNGKRELVMVDFSHKRRDVDAAGQPIEKETFVKVPLLAMLPIPSLRIEHVIIDFNVKLNSVESSKTSTELGVKAELKGGFGPISFKVSTSFQRKTATSVEVKKEYALSVNVKAVQDEIPAGLEKILGMLAA